MTKSLSLARLASSLLSVLACALIVLGVGATWWSGGRAEASQGEPTSVVPDAIDRRSPRAALESFLSASESGHWERASHCLDFSGTGAEPGSAEARRLARLLATVLDKTQQLELDLLSSDAAGNTQDGEATRDILGMIHSYRGEVWIGLTRKDLGAASPWRFESALVARIPELYAEFGYGWLAEFLPRSFFEKSFMQVALWQWIGAALLAFLAASAGMVFPAVVKRFLNTLPALKASDWDDALVDLLAAPLRLLISLSVFYAGTFVLSFSVSVQRFIGIAYAVLILLAMTWLLLRVIDLAAEVMGRRVRDSNPTAANTLVPLGRRIVKVIVLVIAVVSLVHNLGFDAGAVLAGLGVGGLAVALAAQPTLENLFGGFAVVADRPIEVGQNCRIGEHLGTVEDIGMRSIRLRTLERTLVTIPNSDFARSRIENLTERDKFRLFTTLSFTYDTTADQIRWLLVELKKMLLAHPKTLTDVLRVRFTSFGPSSLDIEINAHLDTRDAEEFNALREDIYLRIMDVVKESGAQFAFPSRTVYLGKDAGRDSTRSEAAEARVREWRARNELLVPEVPGRIEMELKGKGIYPPAGSAATS